MSDVKAVDTLPSSHEDELRQGIELLFYAYRDFTAEPDAMLARYGFGRAHHRVIYFVGRHPHMSVSELLGILRITKQSLARVLSPSAIGKALGPRLFPKPEQGELRQKMAERWAKNDKRAYLASFDAIVGWGVRERLSRITCPTLVVSADRDYTPVALKEAYVKLLPDARLVVIEDSRHATPLDQPQRFNQTLLDFMTTVDTTTQDH